MNTETFAKIRPVKINFYLRCMEKFGIKAERILSGTNVTRQKLQDPFFLVDIPAYIKIVSNMMEITQMETLAFKLGDELRLGDIGVLGYAISTSANLAESHPLWLKFNSLFFGNLISCREVPESNGGLFEYKPLIKLHPHLLKFFMEEKINIEIRLFHHFIGITPIARRVTLTYPKPAYAHLYEELLETNVHFNAEKILCKMDFSHAYCAESFKGADKETLLLCTGHLKKIAGVIDTQSSLSAKIELMIKNNLPDMLTAKEMAKEVSLTERTLGRKLAQENCTYKQLVNKVREEMCKNYAATTHMTLNEISNQLGFNNVGSLCRAFKSWTGVTINQYKKTLASFETKA